MKNLILSAIFLSLALASCDSKKTAAPQKRPAQITQVKEEPSLNIVWMVQQVRQQRVKPGNFGKELPYLDLHSDIAAFTGFAGCNRMKGKVINDKTDVLKFTDVITTKMMCESGNMENEFLSALHESSKYEIKGGLLYLYNDIGKIQLIFIPK